MAETKQVTLQTLTAATSTVTGSAVATQTGAFKTYPGTIDLPKKMTVFLDVSAAPGTGPTLNLKVQGQHTGSGTWFDLQPLKAEVSSLFTEVTTTVAANVTCQQVRQYYGPIPTNIRTLPTIGGTLPTYTGVVTAILEY